MFLKSTYYVNQPSIYCWSFNAISGSLFIIIHFLFGPSFKNRIFYIISFDVIVQHSFFCVVWHEIIPIYYSLLNLYE